MKTIKPILILLFFFIIYSSCGQAHIKIDYSNKSNILNPDTLKGDQKIVFNHFRKWTHKEVLEIKTLKLKEEFEKIGILTKENDRFLEAYYFFKLEMTAHKKSIENWKEFKNLAPPKKKSKNYYK